MTYNCNCAKTRRNPRSGVCPVHDPAAFLRKLEYAAHTERGRRVLAQACQDLMPHIREYVNDRIDTVVTTLAYARRQNGRADDYIAQALDDLAALDGFRVNVTRWASEVR